MVGTAVGFAKTNPVSTFVYHSPRLELRLVLRKPTPFQLSYLQVHGWNDGWFCGNQPRSNLRTLNHMVGMTVGLTKTNRFPTLKHERQRFYWQLDLRKPTAFKPSYLKAHGWNDGGIDENQPFSNPHTWAATVGSTVGFAKTNRVPTFVYLNQGLEWRLVLLKPTAILPWDIEAHGWNGGCFAKTNPVPTFVYHSLWLEWRLVLRKPTTFQPSYIIAYVSNDGWFCENQLRSNCRILKSTFGMTVGFAETNRVPTFVP